MFKKCIALCITVHTIDNNYNFAPVASLSYALGYVPYVVIYIYININCL